MKVIICGGGQVGFNIARHLAAESNDVTVIDQSAELIRRVSDSLDVRAMVGHASHPDVLEGAGARDADMIIAVTYADEVNMVACQVAHSLFDVPTKIARVRAQNYLQPIWADMFSRAHMPIDVIISPELEVARAVGRRLEVPGASDMVAFADNRVRVIGVRIDADCPIINTQLRQLTELFPGLSIQVLGIFRGGKVITPTGDDQMVPGDEVYFASDREHVKRAMAAFGHEEREARRLIVLGGGNIGLFLAKQFEKEHHGVGIKIIESNSARAEVVADELSHTVVLQGDALDSDILKEANVQATETIVAVTNDDQVNVLASLLAKRHGCQRAVALINSASYGPLVISLGVDVVINPRAITVSTILQHIRRGRIRQVSSVLDGAAEIIEGEVLETSTLVGTPLNEIRLPAGIKVGAIVRDDEVLIPRGDTAVTAGDRVVVFAAAGMVKKVEQMFSVRLEFF